jgi:hypothetical protein
MAVSSAGDSERARRWIGLLALLVAAVTLLALTAPAAHAQACGNARKAKNVRAFGVGCRPAKRVVAESVSRHKCRSRCSFRKVGHRWSCEQRPSGLNSCEYRFGTSRYTVTFKYTGD